MPQAPLFFLLCLVLLLLLHLPPAHAAEWSKLKTCADLGFCRRHRHFSLSASHAYNILPDTLRIAEWNSASALVAELRSAAPALPPLRLAVLDVGEGAFRVVVTELQPIKERPIVVDALASHVHARQLTGGELEVKVDHALFNVGGGASVRLRFEPVAVELVGEGGDLLVALNRAGRLKVEELRAKPTSQPEGDAGKSSEADGLPVEGSPAERSLAEGEGDGRGEEAKKENGAEGVSEVECDGCWEETFKSHKDSKPRGPESIGCDVDFPFATHIHGIPERTSAWVLPDTVDAEGGVLSEPYRMYNSDVFEFELDKPFGLYGSIPFIMARKGRDAAGMLWMNTAETYVDVRGSSFGEGKKTHWFSETGIVDVYLMPGPTAGDVYRQYLHLTGKPAMPQRFALGYHQCRWNYRDENDSKAVDAGFDGRDIPYDVLWLDIEHTDGKRYFTWDYSRFPDPTGLQKHIAARGRKMVTIIDPHVKRDNKYSLHRLAMERKYYVMKPDGRAFDGWCWPGSSSYFDFTCPDIRSAWAARFNPVDYPHFTEHLYTWIDMNEPSVFNGPEGTMEKDLVHKGGVEHRHVHNIYGHYYMQATFDGLLRGHGGNDRPFVLSRSFFAGSQRYGAIWTGDNTASWEHLESSVRMLLPLQISGMIFSGADVGGFFGNPAPDLLTRWYQTAAFQPFFRGHAHLDTNRREPWLFGEPYTTLISKAVRTRYEYIPLWYTLFAGNALGEKAGFNELQVGPPMRPLWWHFPEDRSVDANQRQWMVGDALLVAPVMEEGVSMHKFYVPDGEIWYDLYDPEGFGTQMKESGIVEKSCGLDRMVVLQRGGTVVPKQERRRRSTVAMARDPFTLIVALDERKKAEGMLYLDDGSSFDHERGNYALRQFRFADNTLTVSTVSGGRKGFMGSDAFIERVVVLGFGETAPASAHVEGKDVGIAYEESTGVLTIQRLKLQVAQGDWKLEIVQ